MVRCLAWRFGLQARELLIQPERGAASARFKALEGTVRAFDLDKNSAEKKKT